MYCKCKTQLPLVRNRSVVKSHRRQRKLELLNGVLLLILITCFFRELCEGLHSLLTIAALRGDGGDVSPAQGPNDVHHGLGLERVRRNHPREEIVALVVAQLRGCRGIADLWNLEEKKTSWGLPESRRCINSGDGVKRVWNHKWWVSLDMQIRQKSLPVNCKRLTFWPEADTCVLQFNSSGNASTLKGDEIIEEICLFTFSL